MSIRKLDINVANQIAAGEVIENPSSVVKELIENSLDAGAKSIQVTLKNGGLEEITVIDDGVGIPFLELPLAVKRHATSKINSVRDLQEIRTLGFRGEALPSIASVSKMKITTHYMNEEMGSYLYVEGGEEKESGEIAHPLGTKVTVKELFYNTPARRKFLKGIRAETAKVSQIIHLLALSRPGVSISLKREKGSILETPGDGSLFNAIVKIYGKDLAKNLIPVNFQEEEYSIQGYISNPFFTWKNRNYQFFYVNNRYVRSQLMKETLDESFKNIVTSKRYPAAFIFLSAPPKNLDVNVHPTKIEVRFNKEESLRNFLKNSLYQAFSSADLVPSFQNKDDKDKERDYFMKQEPFRKKDKKEKQVRINTDGYKIEKEDKYKNFFSEPLSKTSDHGSQSSSTLYESTDTYDMADEHESLTEELLYGQLLGQLFSTYILLQQNEILFLIDQHAAHERIIFEKMILKNPKEELYTQERIPLSMELPISLAENILDKLDLLAEFGLQFEQFGNNTFILRTVPLFLKESITEEIIRDILEDISKKSPGDKEIKKEIKILLSCKAAVKANQTLTKEEMDSLLTQLKSTENPYTCPHGRPVIFKLEKNEVEKFFKRRG